jgi:rhodanese-related sulfurtransferase/polyisoprenoid-binding protein YceI
MSTQLSTISTDHLAQQLQNGSSLILLDVRLLEDFEAGHLPGAKSNCVFEIAFGDRLAALAPDKETAVCVYGVGRNSHESSMAAEKLCRAGYAKVWDFRDGFDGWKETNHSVEGASPRTRVLPPRWTGSREIDLVESRVQWIGRNLLNKHDGSIGLRSGILRFEGGQLAGGEFVFNMRDLACADLRDSSVCDILIAHLGSHDFFDVDLYPEGRFVITKVEPTKDPSDGAPNLAIHGELTLKGVTHPIGFAAVSGLTADGKLAAQAMLSFDRTLWNVLYGSGKLFQNLGGHLVNDLIEVQLRIVTL